MINLCLVVIATQFSETKKREMERMRLERARFQSSSTLASSTNNSEPTSCYAEIVKYIAHLWRRSKRRLLKKIRLYRVRRDQRRERKMISGETIRLNYAKRHHPNCPRLRQHVREVNVEADSYLRFVLQSHSVPSTRAVSRRSSVCLSENRSEEVELSGVSKRPSLLRVPSASNQEISTNNNDVRAENILRGVGHRFFREWEIRGRYREIWGRSRENQERKGVSGKAQGDRREIYGRYNGRCKDIQGRYRYRYRKIWEMQGEWEEIQGDPSKSMGDPGKVQGDLWEIETDSR
jgi:hypothetical protein